MTRYSSSRSRSRGRSRSRSRSAEEEGFRVHVADIGTEITQKDLEKSFTKFGDYHEIWMARNPPCFAFIVYKHKDDAEEAIREMNGETIAGQKIKCSWARPRVRGGRDRGERDRGGSSSDLRCYNCDRRGHFSRSCPDRYRSSRYSDDDDYDRRRRSSRRSRSRSRHRSRSSSRHRRRRSLSYSRSRSRSRSRSPRRRRYSRSRSRDSRRRRSRSNSRRRDRRSRSRSNSRHRRHHDRSRSRSPAAKRSHSSRSPAPREAEPLSNDLAVATAVPEVNNHQNVEKEEEINGSDDVSNEKYDPTNGIDDDDEDDDDDDQVGEEPKNGDVVEEEN